MSRNVDPSKVMALAEQLGLPMTQARACELVPLVNDVFTMLDQLDPKGLGEAPPAFAFNAKWE